MLTTRRLIVAMLFLCIHAGVVSAGDDRDTLVSRDWDPALAMGTSARFAGGGELVSAPSAGHGAGGIAISASAGTAAVAAIDRIPPAAGRVGTESLIGKRDTQVRVYPGTAPASANALITFTANGKPGYCTGWFYGPNVLATAGHCVHEGKGGDWHANVTVYPAYDAGSAPFGSFPAANLYTSTGWRVDGNDQFDYGFIKLDTNIGDSTGYYGVWVKSGSLKGLPAIIAGYPDKKAPAKSLWLSTDVVRISKSRQIFYRNDTYAGESGSAVWLDRPVSKGLEDGPYAYAIHTSGTTVSPTSTSAYNSATRIDKTVFENMMLINNSAQ